MKELLEILKVWQRSWNCDTPPYPLKKKKKKSNSRAKSLVSPPPTTFLSKGAVKELSLCSTESQTCCMSGQCCTCSGHRCYEVSPSLFCDAFCHRFSPAIHLRIHIPTLYVTLSLLYSSLVLCNARLLYWPVFYPGCSHPRQGRKKIITSSTCHLKIKAFFFQNLAPS